MTEVRYLHTLTETRLLELTLDELSILETGPFVFPIWLFSNTFFASH